MKESKRMRFVDIIEKKRDGLKLSESEIQYFIDGVVDGTIPDYQVSSFLMAIYFQGMDKEETAHLTKAMMYSGDVVDLSMIEGIKVDKHSTGGVGDKTTIALTAMVAACGAKVAKMSGRGLGHTGGTLDKLESINGFECFISKNQFEKQVNEIGLAVIGQSGSMVYADKKLYALRDVTATVKSIPLIASSIMSKKLASGSDAILLDVKYGEGAFMSTVEEATLLAEAMIDIGKQLNRDIKAVISNMNQPLGNTIGNSLEVREAIDTLNGKGPNDFLELCIDLGTIMLLQAKICNTKQEAKERLIESIHSKSALNKLVEMVKYQGGDVNQILNPDLLPKSKHEVVLYSKKTGYIHDLKALELGVLAMKLGAGRETKEQEVNHAVGIELFKKVGDIIDQDSPLAKIYYDSELSKEWINDFYNCFEIKIEICDKPKLIEKILE